VVRRADAFTLIELLVVIAVVALLLVIALPTLAGARTATLTVACGAKLQQLGIATSLYLADSRNALPQTILQDPASGPWAAATLFGGKRGRLPLLGIDQMGPAERPLNQYVHGMDALTAADAGGLQAPAFRSPLDRGAEQLFLPLPEYSSPDSIYDLLGSSYVLNDHTLDGDRFSTLIPERGGAMPTIADPTRTWMIGSHTIYNFQQDSDRGQRWYSPEQAVSNLLFVDGHARLRLRQPDVFCEVENTTADYTFLPVPDGRIY
jgi:prepilin-type N-terminal cleavage/methylation domain-containing protein/prepilin-type processing-associated H-X9-DG protein